MAARQGRDSYLHTLSTPKKYLGIFAVMPTKQTRHNLNAGRSWNNGQQISVIRCVMDKNQAISTVMSQWYACNEHFG